MTNTNTATDPTRIFQIENDLQTRFLSDDLQDVCDCAVASGNPLLICNATASLEARTAILEGWRVKQVKMLIAKNPIVGDYLSCDCDDVVRDGYLAGKLALNALNEAIALAALERQLAAEAAAEAANDRLEKSLRKNVQGTTAADFGFALVPAAVLIDETGKVQFFNHFPTAREFAVASGKRLYLGKIEYRGEFLG